MSVRLLINIPKEFEQHFQADRFEDSLHRLSADAHLLAGNYEQETALMLIESFKNAVPIPSHGRLINADELHKLFEEQWHYLQVLDWDENPTAEAKQSGINWCINTMHDNAPTIIEAEGGE